MTPFLLVDCCVSAVFGFAIFRISALFGLKRLRLLYSSLHGVTPQKTCIAVVVVGGGGGGSAVMSPNIGLSTVRLFHGVLFVT
jgi:hypothetical protein